MSYWRSSLRTFWNKIISERESYYAELGRMHEHLEDFAQTIKRKEKEHAHGHHGHEERSRELLKI